MVRVVRAQCVHVLSRTEGMRGFVRVACGGLIRTHFPAASLFPVASLVFLYARCADHFSLESLSQCQDDTSSIAMVYSTRQVIKETGVVRLPLPL